MTKLDRAVEVVRTLPADVQDDLADVLLQLAGEEQPVHDVAVEAGGSFETSFAQSRRGAFATDEQIQAIWSKHGL